MMAAGNRDWIRRRRGTSFRRLAPCQKRITPAVGTLYRALCVHCSVATARCGGGLSAAPDPAGTHVVDEIASQPGADVHAIALVLVNGEHGLDLVVDPDLNRS